MIKKGCPNLFYTDNDPLLWSTLLIVNMNKMECTDLMAHFYVTKMKSTL